MRIRLVVIGMLLLLSAVITSVLFAQGTQKPVDGSGHEALLAEVRALRDEVHQAASAGIRMQLLVARLQLQEQRVLMAGRQLLEVQSALVAVQQEIAGERARIVQLEKSLSHGMAQGQAQLQLAILEAKAQIEKQQRQEQELQAQEAQSLKAVTDAQIQWMDFSKRLDELEQSVPAAIAAKSLR